jgi:hypothetical protein
MRQEHRGVSKAALRGKRRKERVAIMNAAAPTGVQVVPANDDYRKVLKHPKAGGFPESGAAAWPDDRFTKRRLADGSVTVEAPDPPREGETQRRDDNGDKRQRAQRDQSRQRVEHPDEGLRENIDPDRNREPDIARRDNDPNRAAS